jgi:hypothetical protein
MIALGYGSSIWSKVNSLPLTEALPLADLTILLGEHIQTLIALCKLNVTSKEADDCIISDLSKFYQAEEIPTPNSKRGDSLRKILINQTTVQVPTSAVPNYYESLFLEEVEDEITYKSPKIASKPNPVIMMNEENPTQASFPEDLAISEVETLIRHRQTVTAMEEDEKFDPQSNPIAGSPPKTTTITTTDTLIRDSHRIIFEVLSSVKMFFFSLLSYASYS